jgi:class 3 adenylate cyclase
MPLYLDRHNLPSVSAEDVAHAHARDVEVQAKHGVRFITYWFDVRTCCAFCLVEAPSAEAAVRVHQESHGLVPSQLIEVDPAVVEAFMGRITDPAATVHECRPIDETGRRVVMFTDIVNSTEMTTRLGDARATDMVRSHDAMVRRELAVASGREVKHLGDGIMAVFADEHKAVGCACAIQREIAQFNDNSREPLSIRIGMHAGDPVEDNNDLFGVTVQLAARICSDAPLDAVVISHDLHGVVGQRFPATPLGRRMFKGFKDPVPVYSVDWRA